MPSPNELAHFSNVKLYRDFRGVWMSLIHSRVFVSPGQAIDAGDVLVSVEAML